MLRRVCAPVERFDTETRRFARDMLATMYAAKGRGLAAPQVGRPLRLFVFDVGWKDGHAAPLVCANPSVIALTEETALAEETCLSIPGTPCLVRRPTRVLLRWHDLDAGPREAAFEGPAAVIVQHEADHLDGRLCIDFAEVR